MHALQDVHIRNTVALVAPQQIKADLPATKRIADVVVSRRAELVEILEGRDDRVFVIVGPCSIHNEKSALEYAEKLRTLAEEVSDRMMLVMRVYFEKPRTTVGWKGLINDPHLDDTFDIGEGMKIARSLLLNITSLGLATGTEMLEPITPQYIADLITQASIGARTTESPTHRQMASGLSVPVGFKNSTEGSLEVAINAMQASKAPHSFLGIDRDGKICVVNTTGNPWGHLILRGGRKGPNYDAKSLASASEQLGAAGMQPRFVVDCSHANSSKDFTKQSVAWNDVLHQRANGNKSIVGLMLESNLREGKQKLTADPGSLQYGVSITDGCIGWEETETLIRDGFKLLG